MMEKYKVWHDPKWTGLILNGGGQSVTVSLTRAQAEDLRLKLLPPEVHLLEMELCDTEAHEDIMGLQIGHVLTEEDVKKIYQVCAYDFGRMSDQDVSDFHSGYAACLRDIGGDELVQKHDLMTDAESAASFKKVMKMINERTQKAKDATTS